MGVLLVADHSEARLASRQTLATRFSTVIAKYR